MDRPRIAGTDVLFVNCYRTIYYTIYYISHILHGTAIGLPPQPDPAFTTPTDRWQSHGVSGYYMNYV